MKEVVKKFKFKDKGIVLNAPAKLEEQLVKLGFTTSFDKKVQSSNTLVFFNTQAELVKFLKSSLKNIEPDSVLWLAYPKGTSKIKTDINRDTVWSAVGDFGLKTVTAVSIDDTWSALRVRPIEKVGT